MADRHGAVALGAIVDLGHAVMVDGPHVDPLGVGLAVGSEGQHHGPVVDRDRHTVDDDVALVLGELVTVGVVVGSARAQPDRVALTVGQRHRVDQRVVDLLLRRAGCGDGDVYGVRGELAASPQPDLVPVDVAKQVGRVVVAWRATLSDRGEPVVLLDQDDPDRVGGYVGLDPVGGQSVVIDVTRRGDDVVDGTADAFKFERDDVLGDVAADVDRVGAEAADHAVGDAECRRQHEELVVTFETVDLDDLDLFVTHVETGTEDALVGDHEVVGELGTEHGKLVDPGATVDRDRCIDVVLDLVVATACADVERLVGREPATDDRRGDAIDVEWNDVVEPSRRDACVGVVANSVVVVVLAERLVEAGRLAARADVVVVGIERVGTGDLVGMHGHVEHGAQRVAGGVTIAGGGESERSHDEQVVVVVAFEPQFGLVGVDGEAVLPGASMDHHRCADAGRQPAAGGSDQIGERVLREQSPAVVRLHRVVDSECRALGAELLTDLEHVVAAAAVERDRHRAVVAVEVIVAAVSEHGQATVEAGVVVDPLDVGVLSAVVVARAVESEVVDVAVQQGHEAWPVGDLGRADAVGVPVGVDRVQPLLGLGVDAGHPAQQEDVVARQWIGLVERGRVAVDRRLDAVHEGLVDAVVLVAGVEDVDQVVAGDSLGAGGPDLVGVTVGLAVERQRVAGGGDRAGTGGRCRRDERRLQEVDEEAVLTIVAGWDQIVVAANPGLGAEVDVARVTKRLIG